MPISSKLLRALFEKLRGAQQANKGGAARDVFAPDQTANPGAVLEVPSAAVTGARKNVREAQPLDRLEARQTLSDDFQQPQFAPEENVTMPGLSPVEAGMSARDLTSTMTDKELLDVFPQIQERMRRIQNLTTRQLDEQNTIGNLTSDDLDDIPF